MSILDGKIDDMTEEMNEELTRLRAENEALKSKIESRKERGEGISVVVKHGEIEKEYVLTMKVSEKGCLSVYGAGRFPLSGYPLVWLAILAIGDEMKAFIAKNSDKLSWVKSSVA